MIIKGTTLEEWKIITSILEKYKNKYEFYFYGSRVNGNFRPISDLDIMIKGKQPVELEDLETMKELFDESAIPYVVNFVDYFSLTEDFFNIIKPDLVQL